MLYKNLASVCPIYGKFLAKNFSTNVAYVYNYSGMSSKEYVTSVVKDVLSNKVV